MTCVSETGRVLQKKQLNNSDRFLSGQDTGQPVYTASSGFFFLFSTTFSWVPGTPELQRSLDLPKTPPPNFSGTAALSLDHWGGVENGRTPPKMQATTTRSGPKNRARAPPGTQHGDHSQEHAPTAPPQRHRRHRRVCVTYGWFCGVSHAARVSGSRSQIPTLQSRQAF